MTQDKTKRRDTMKTVNWPNGFYWVKCSEWVLRTFPEASKTPFIVEVDDGHIKECGFVEDIDHDEIDYVAGPLVPPGYPGDTCVFPSTNGR